MSFNPDHQAFPCSFHCLVRHLFEFVYFDNPFDLREQPIQESKVSTVHPDNRRDSFIVSPRTF
jgi:hypothetical protein